MTIPIYELDATGQRTDRQRGEILQGNFGATKAQVLVRLNDAGSAQWVELAGVQAQAHPDDLRNLRQSSIL